jgi:hypothetical protein
LREPKPQPHPFDIFRSHAFNIRTTNKMSTRNIANAIYTHSPQQEP